MREAADAFGLYSWIGFSGCVSQKIIKPQKTASPETGKGSSDFIRIVRLASLHIAAVNGNDLCCDEMRVITC